jgi:DNA-binding protein H-NS
MGRDATVDDVDDPFAAFVKAAPATASNHRKARQVARKLAVRTIVTWFHSQSFEQQREALAQLEQAHEQSRAAKRAELEKQIAALGYGVRKKRGRPRVANGRSNGATPTKARTARVKVKYRDPKTKETWSGRGRMASWLAAKQGAGEKIEKYLV